MSLLWTVKGYLDTKFLAIRGASTWTEYRYRGELVRRDAQAKLKSVKLKGAAQELEEITVVPETENPFDVSIEVPIGGHTPDPPFDVSIEVPLETKDNP